MTPELKSKWIAALRSGEYKQTRGILKNTQGHCCLGVLCEVVGPLPRRIEIKADEIITYGDDDEDFEASTLTQELVPELSRQLNLPDQVVDGAMGRNDGTDSLPQSTFPEIADWLESLDF